MHLENIFLRRNQYSKEDLDLEYNEHHLQLLHEKNSMICGSNFPRGIASVKSEFISAMKQSETFPRSSILDCLNYALATAKKTFLIQ